MRLKLQVLDTADETVFEQIVELPPGGAVNVGPFTSFDGHLVISEAPAAEVEASPARLDITHG